MCGASSQQQQLEQEQSDFYKTAIAESAAVFGEQQDLQKQIEGVFMPILKAGPSQMGFSRDELNVLNAQSVEGTAQNYQKAAKAIQEKLAAQGGGNIPLTTGAQEQLQGEITTASAEEQSAEQTHILESGYQQGYQEFQDATKALDAVSGQLTPTNYTTAATTAGSAAASTANQIAQENNSWINAALGAAGTIGGAVVSENPKGIFG
jgi:hypothetical protein